MQYVILSNESQQTLNLFVTSFKVIFAKSSMIITNCIFIWCLTAIQGFPTLVLQTSLHWISSNHLEFGKCFRHLSTKSSFKFWKKNTPKLPPQLFIQTNYMYWHFVTAPRNCHQCGDLASSSPCSTLQVYTAPSTPCPAGLDFCMTDIHHDTSGNDHIYKRF